MLLRLPPVDLTLTCDPKPPVATAVVTARRWAMNPLGGFEAHFRGEIVGQTWMHAYTEKELSTLHPSLPLILSALISSYGSIATASVDAMQVRVSIHLLKHQPVEWQCPVKGTRYYIAAIRGISAGWVTPVHFGDGLVGADMVLYDITTIADGINLAILMHYYIGMIRVDWLEQLFTGSKERLIIAHHLDLPARPGAAFICYGESETLPEKKLPEL